LFSSLAYSNIKSIYVNHIRLCVCVECVWNHCNSIEKNRSRNMFQFIRFEMITFLCCQIFKDYFRAVSISLTLRIDFSTEMLLKLNNRRLFVGGAENCYCNCHLGDYLILLSELFSHIKRHKMKFNLILRLSLWIIVSEDSIMFYCVP
jgi:hypothetical protein